MVDFRITWTLCTGAVTNSAYQTLELLRHDERTKSRTLLAELRHTECAYYY